MTKHCNCCSFLQVQAASVRMCVLAQSDLLRYRMLTVKLAGQQHGVCCPCMYDGRRHLASGSDGAWNDEHRRRFHHERHLAFPTIHGGGFRRSYRRHRGLVRRDLRRVPSEQAESSTSADLTFSTYNSLETTASAGASYYLAATCSAIVWGMLADRLGRRPTLLAGTLGTCVANLVFGFAPNYKVAVFGR